MCLLYIRQGQKCADMHTWNYQGNLIANYILDNSILSTVYQRLFPGCTHVQKPIKHRSHELECGLGAKPSPV